MEIGYEQNEYILFTYTLLAASKPTSLVNLVDRLVDLVLWIVGSLTSTH